MISVGMREYCGLNESCVFANQLQSQFRTGIDEEFALRSTNQYSRARSLVFVDSANDTRCTGNPRQELRHWCRFP